MRTHLDCLPCFLRQATDAARRCSDDEALHEQLLREVLALLQAQDFATSPPEIAQAMHRRLRELLGQQDPYREAKAHFNRLASEALDGLRQTIATADDRLYAAARAAVAANAIDMGQAAAISDEEVLEALRSAPDASVHGDWAVFRAAEGRAEEILYLADNAGELAVDRLAIEELGPERVTLAVRGAAVLNDVTRHDAAEVGLDALVEVIDNGSDAPGTILDDCSVAFRQRFEAADLIIAKGQGNFETLNTVEDRPIAFWFKVKCPLVAKETGLPRGTLALLPPSTPLGAAP